MGVQVFELSRPELEESFNLSRMTLEYSWNEEATVLDIFHSI